VRWPAASVSWLSHQWQQKGLWYRLTLPLAWCYAAVVGLNAWLYRQGWRKAYASPVPVIVVGNLYVGGTGKTPVTIELARLLGEQGWRPGLVSRGYGAQSKTHPAVGRGADLDWRVFGDEPALIAAITAMPIAVHPDRCAAVRQLLCFDPAVNIILSDDGLQHYRLGRNMEIMVEDERGMGNGATLPAGPLREASSRRRRVDLILRRGGAPTDGAEASRPHTFPFAFDLQHFTCPATQVRLDAAAMAQHIHASHAKVIALAGIGVPQRFFDSLRDKGIQVDETIALPDHDVLNQQTLAKLDAATILMTAKDAVKYATHDDPRIWVAQLSIDWPSQAIETWLLQKLPKVKR